MRKFFDTKVLLVGLDTGEESDFEHSMDELKSLAEAAGKQVSGIITQRMEQVNNAFYIGTGKVEEVREYALQCEAEEVIFDNALTPSQMRNLGRELKLPVLDRTNLILDIFALRARTREAKLQVETRQAPVHSAQAGGNAGEFKPSGRQRRRGRRQGQREQQRRGRDKAGTGQAQNRTSDIGIEEGTGRGRGAFPYRKRHGSDFSRIHALWR